MEDVLVPIAVVSVLFLGLPWLSRRGSSFIWGVWHDARFIADQIAIQLAYAAYRPMNRSEAVDR